MGGRRRSEHSSSSESRLFLTGLWPTLGRIISAIPTPLAQAMLAGVLMPLCLAPIIAVRDAPAAVAPVILVWLAAQRFSKRWAVPLAFLTAAVVIGISLVTSDRVLDAGAMIPRIDLTAPSWTWQAMIGIAIPLYIVTMASQNIPGVAVMKFVRIHRSLATVDDRDGYRHHRRRTGPVAMRSTSRRSAQPWPPPPPHIRIPNVDGSLPSPQAGRISFSLPARPRWPLW